MYRILWNSKYLSVKDEERENGNSTNQLLAHCVKSMEGYGV